MKIVVGLKRDIFESHMRVVATLRRQEPTEVETWQTLAATLDRAAAAAREVARELETA